jgi:Mitochondrial glycoprotein
MKKSIKSLFYLSQPLRYFGSPADKKLAKFLDVEITKTFKNYKFDDDFIAFLKLRELELEDFEHTVQTVLRKKYPNHSVEINFEAKCPISAEYLKSLNLDAEELAKGNFVDFNVFITNTSKNSGIFIDCCSFSSKLEVRSVTYSSNMKIFEDSDESNQLFNGPDFETWDNKVVEGVMQYLKQFQIDSDLASFIESYAYDKEQRLYMSWLQKLKAIL